MVTGDDHLGISGDCTFQNSVVRVVGEHLHSSARSHTLSDLVHEDRYASELFAVAAELPCEHAEKGSASPWDVRALSRSTRPAPTPRPKLTLRLIGGGKKAA